MSGLFKKATTKASRVSKQGDKFRLEVTIHQLNAGHTALMGKQVLLSLIRGSKTVSTPPRLLNSTEMEVEEKLSMDITLFKDKKKGGPYDSKEYFIEVKQVGGRKAQMAFQFDA
eukprot:CAMPEP_0194564782 /NCGR_PEP_ID=MMETSP0292-20121207/4297_1 /TAXON_ID=39354 /ORGANISM="Heterosigma akashiwo, Strain CCMP2393" /LENGTH=113 /DNA_ID=CAMNT_0039413975 /DNA_START=33 /DNA_END=371 /DNA_ORIENTATION=-